MYRTSRRHPHHSLSPRRCPHLVARQLIFQPRMCTRSIRQLDRLLKPAPLMVWISLTPEAISFGLLTISKSRRFGIGGSRPLSFGVDDRVNVGNFSRSESSLYHRRNLPQTLPGFTAATERSRFTPATSHLKSNRLHESVNEA